MDIQSSALSELFTLYPVIIMGWVTPVKPADRAHGGIPKSLYDDQPRGLRCLIDPWTELQRRSWTMAVDDRADLYVNDDPFPVAGKDVGPGEEQLRMELHVPHGRLLDGVNRLHYKVTRPGQNGAPSRDLLVLYHLRAPGEPAPQGLDLVIPPDVIADGVSAERAAQGVAFGFTYSNRRTYDRINFLIGNATVPFEVLDGSVPVVHTLFTDTFVQAGDNPDTPLEFRVMDQLGNSNQSAIKYIAVHLDQIEPELPAPIVEGVQDGGTLDPSQTVQVWTRVPGDRLNPGDDVTVTWTDSNGAITPYVSPPKPYTANDQPNNYLRFLIPAADVLRFLGKNVRVTYTRDRNGTITGPSLAFNMRVETPVSQEPFKVMGARFNRTTYRASGSSRLLSALHATTLQPLRVEWKYLDESSWSAPSASWRDTQPSKPLQVRSSSHEATVNPANIFGNGADTLTNGGAAFVALLDQGSVVGWGNSDFGAAPPALNNIVEISCTQSAYAALDSGGTVHVWGDPAAGGMMGSVLPYGFADLTANGNAFAGRKTSNNSLVAWGRSQQTDLIPPELGGLPGTTHVYGASQAFAVRRLNNPVVAWGRNWDGDYGGTIPVGLVITDAVDIMGSFAAFAVLRTGGRVVAWGNPAYGGTSPNLSGIASLGCSNAQAFCVLNNSQQVQSWGTPDYGGGGVPSPNSNVVEVVSTWRAFAARRSDGTVGAWGRVSEGGTAPPGLDNVVQIAGSSEAFAALRSDGTIVVWGNQSVGGVAPTLTNVLALYSNSHGFTALTSTGDVVSWGHSIGGGNNASVIHLLRNNVSYYRSPPAPRPLAAQAEHASSSS
ncbi:RCC1 domain-containing protein [Pseudomonas sp. Z6-14]|uniref:RCC1 domain-containing protein n=1 Tax=Pseudomonas sp. Z6-14 TaxID=2817416 RepID=UPI003DA85D0C